MLYQREPSAGREERIMLTECNVKLKAVEYQGQPHLLGGYWGTVRIGGVSRGSRRPGIIMDRGTVKGSCRGGQQQQQQQRALGEKNWTLPYTLACTVKSRSSLALTLITKREEKKGKDGCACPRAL
jgi:hypothetical protein